MEKIIYLLSFVFICTYAVPLDDPSGPSVRIINGNEAGNNQFPYAVSVQLLNPVGNPQHRCGGALITLLHVLTSAGCTFNTVTGQYIPILASQLRIVAGGVSLVNPTADRIRVVANYSVHPQYLRAPSHFNDIAVLAVTTPFSIQHVAPISIPSSNFNPVDFTQCTVAGWGSNDLLNASVISTNQLQFVHKYVYNQDLCTFIFNSNPLSPNIFSSMVCAASYDITSSGCIGDQGNALVCNNVLTGIAFYNGDCSPTSFPELYTRVSNYTTWIRSLTGAGSTFTPGVFTLVFLLVHVLQKVIV